MIRGVNGVQTATARQNVARQQGAAAFGKALESALRQDGLRLSSHAQERLRERNITIGEADMQRIGAAASKVAAKGGRDALVVMDGVGLILDVRNRTIVTAMDRDGMNDSVFTNIDSAVFA